MRSFRFWIYFVIVGSLWGQSALGLGQTSGLNWSSDGNFALYQKRTGQQAGNYFLINLEQRTQRIAFDRSELVQKLGRRFDPKKGLDRLPIQGLFQSPTAGLCLVCDNRLFKIPAGQGGAIKEVESGLSDSQAFREQESRLFLQPEPGKQGKSTNITLVNKSSLDLDLNWYSHDGKEVSYGQLEAGTSKQMHTFAGHVWVLRHDGQIKGCFRARINDHVFISPETLKSVSKFENRREKKTQIDPLYKVRGGKSKNRNWNVSVQDFNLTLTSTEDSSLNVKLTENGADKSSFVISRNRSAKTGTPNVYWSPNSKFFLAFQTEKKTKRQVYYVESTPKKQLQPKLHQYDYPKPGDELDQSRLRLFSAETQSEIELSDELFSNPFRLNFLGWSQSGQIFWLLYNQRGHQVKRLLKVESATGKVEAIVEERSDTFIHYSDPGKAVFENLGNDEILWASERSGWNHLYRYNRVTGELINRVTQGDWNVKRIHSIDHKTRTVYFYAVGVYPDQDPYHVHFCRVQFDGGGFKVLTEGDGNHRVELISPTGNPSEPTVFVDTYSRVDFAPVTELRDLESGERIVKLQAENTSKAFGDRKLTQRFVAKGRDGQTDIWGILHFPKDFDPQKKYPVVENIYAGPHDHHVPKTFRRRYGVQHEIADAGMIVVQIDGMGTAWRSKAFHDVCYKNLRDAGFPDRKEWMKQAAKKFPQMDLTRVGIYGGSAGGQNAMAALLWHHDFYDVAVADCGCHDNRMDKIWWNEQWMGWPVDDSYAANSNRENAHLLQGQLMLTLGEMDENVDPASTIQVVHELIKHDKDFEFVLIPGRGHGAGETAWARKKRLNFFVEHLIKNPE
ncbi:MAG: prolyl oligopeptidase family serine peptidase [Planctomycetota bacterium]